MKKYFLFLFALLILSCSKEDDDYKSPVNEFFPEQLNKTQILEDSNENQFKIYWKKGDNIEIQIASGEFYYYYSDYYGDVYYNNDFIGIIRISDDVEVDEFNMLYYDVNQTSKYLVPISKWIKFDEDIKSFKIDDEFSIGIKKNDGIISIIYKNMFFE